MTNRGGEPASFDLLSGLQMLPIEKLVPGGMALGRLASQVVFVKGGIPGETLLVNIGQKRKGYCEAELLQIQHSSPDRITPLCSVYGLCGGCQLQHLTYESQLIQKRKMLQDAFSRIGKLTCLDIPKVVPSLAPYGYRNNARFLIFRDHKKLRLGFHKMGSRKAIPVSECHLLPSESRKIVASVAERLQTISPIPLYLESVEIRRSIFFGSALLIFQGGFRNTSQARSFLNEFMDVPGVTGCTLESSIHSYGTSSGCRQVVEGNDHLQETFDGLRLRIGFRSFMQSNWSVYEIIGRTLNEWIGGLNNMRVLELYAGIGAIGLSLARRGALVTLVEPNALALADARRSASLNHIGRCRFRVSSAEKYLSGVRGGEYDVGIVDPPRTGLSTQVVKKLGTIRMGRVFYLSCDAPTLARDLSRLCAFGYRVVRVQPFDMFPQTAHIETLVELML